MHDLKYQVIDVRTPPASAVDAYEVPRSCLDARRATLYGARA